LVSLLQIGASEVREALPMADCIDLMAEAMRAVSSGDFDAPPRQVEPLEGGHFFLMPGSMRRGPCFGAKLMSLIPTNPGRGLPVMQGFVVLFDHDSGAPLALVDGAAITYLRTAAVSALATRTLARPEALSHGIFGAGRLAEEHLRAIAAVRPVTETRVWTRKPQRARDFAERMRNETGMAVVASDPRDAAACDIVSTVTNAAEPVLQGRWLSAGCHVNLVGAHRPDRREADSDTAAGAAIYVDTRAGALREAGDLLIPMTEGRLGEPDLRGELGAVLAGAAEGRRDARERTLFKSLGHVAQDLSAAAAVYEAVRDGR
jgi:ornithine cyclodeaminase/alanine dehydrogenase-like protein (mu-crystallin family)